MPFTFSPPSVSGAWPWIRSPGWLARLVYGPSKLSCKSASTHYIGARRRSALALVWLETLTNLWIPIQIALFNGILFLGSIGTFLWIMVYNFLRRRALIASAIRLPLPGCPSINGGTQWAQWIPGTFSLRLFQ